MREGFLGGTFDPLHLGHLSLAQEALERYSLQSVSFVPAKNPPHKNPEDLTPFNHRLEMLSLALASNPSFQIADIEGSTSPSYTVKLLESLTASGCRPFFIMGMDSLCEMHTWREPFRITQLARVLVGARPGFDPSTVSSELIAEVEIFEFPGVWISSSDIRLRVSQGRSISYLVPDCVESYIRNRGLYGTEKGH